MRKAIKSPLNSVEHRIEYFFANIADEIILKSRSGGGGGVGGWGDPILDLTGMIVVSFRG